MVQKQKMNPEAYAQTSRQAYEAVKPFQGELHQRILAVLSLGPTYRENLEKQTGMKGNTLRPRVVELLRHGIIDVIGTTLNNGRLVEVLAISSYYIENHEAGRESLPASYYTTLLPSTTTTTTTTTTTPTTILQYI